MHAENAFDRINAIIDSEFEPLECKIQNKELVRAVKVIMKNNNTSGADRNPIKILHFFLRRPWKITFKSVNESNDDREFSIVQREGKITCTPKTDKGREYLKMLHPITE